MRVILYQYLRYANVAPNACLVKQIATSMEQDVHTTNQCAVGRSVRSSIWQDTANLVGPEFSVELGGVELGDSLKTSMAIQQSDRFPDAFDVVLGRLDWVCRSVLWKIEGTGESENDSLS